MSIAAISPVCASEITSFTPPSPRAFSERRNAVQNGCDSVSPTSKPRTSLRDDDGLGDDPPADAGFAVGRVEEHVRVRAVRERPIAERRDVLVEVAADPRHLRLADPGVGTERLHQVVDLAGGDAVDVRLHHDREQGLIDPAAAFQQRREKRSLPQLRDPQLQLPRGGGEGPQPGPVALRRTVRGAFERGSADERSCFRVDQLLVERLGRDPDPVVHIGEFQFPE